MFFIVVSCYGQVKPLLPWHKIDITSIATLEACHPSPQSITYITELRTKIMHNLYCRTQNKNCCRTDGRSDRQVKRAKVRDTRVIRIFCSVVLCVFDRCAAYIAQCNPWCEDVSRRTFRSIIETSGHRSLIFKKKNDIWLLRGAAAIRRVDLIVFSSIL